MHGGGSAVEKTFDNNINIQKINNKIFMSNKPNQQFRHARSGSASAETQHSSYSPQRLSHNLKCSSGTKENHESTIIYTNENSSVFNSSNINTRRSFHMDELKHLETLCLVRRAHQQNKLSEVDKTKLVKTTKSPPSVSQSQQFRYGRKWSPACAESIVVSRQQNIQNSQQLKNYNQHQIPIPQEFINERNFVDKNINDNTKVVNMSKSVNQPTIVSYSNYESQKINDSALIGVQHSRKNNDTNSTENVSFVILH